MADNVPRYMHTIIPSVIKICDCNMPKKSLPEGTKKVLFLTCSKLFCRMQLAVFAPGETLYKSGDSSDFIFILAEVEGISESMAIQSNSALIRARPFCQ